MFSKLEPCPRFIAPEKWSNSLTMNEFLSIEWVHLMDSRSGADMDSEAGRVKTGGQYTSA